MSVKSVSQSVSQSSCSRVGTAYVQELRMDLFAVDSRFTHDFFLSVGHGVVSDGYIVYVSDQSDRSDDER